jgi:hypothetical protein
LFAACADKGSAVDNPAGGDAAGGDGPAPGDGSGGGDGGGGGGGGGSGDLGLGDVLDEMPPDGTWGYALICKQGPALAALPNPKITLSIDGLTLRLTDATTGFDKVYPVGSGKIEEDPASGTYLESYSYEPIILTGRQDFQITPSSIQPCKTWWTDPDSGAESPVFAGLPFLSFYGNYGIHGPIDNYRAANGGTLRRGYVSHGCFRMEAADILEVYALIKDVASVPVHLQREPERTVEHAKIDVPDKWIGAECTTDAECAYADGFCAENWLTGQGFCTASCSSTCADRVGYPTTFCVANPDEPGTGMCVNRSLPTNFECRPYDHFGGELGVERFNNPSVKANVCLPMSRGWVGDHCFTNGDCINGAKCSGMTATKAGICTMACSLYCADMPGVADTFCANIPALNPVAGQGSCVRQCTPESNASECPTDMKCVAQPRNGDPGVVKNVCVPK